MPSGGRRKRAVRTARLPSYVLQRLYEWGLGKGHLVQRNRSSQVHRAATASHSGLRSNFNEFNAMPWATYGVSESTAARRQYIFKRLKRANMK